MEIFVASGSQTAWVTKCSSPNIWWLRSSAARSWSRRQHCLCPPGLTADTHWAPVAAHRGWESPPGPGTGCGHSFSSTWGWVHIYTEWSACLLGGSLHVLLHCRRREAALEADFPGVSHFVWLSNFSFQQKKQLTFLSKGNLWSFVPISDSASTSPSWDQSSDCGFTSSLHFLCLASFCFLYLQPPFTHTHTHSSSCVPGIVLQHSTAGSSLQLQLFPNPSHLYPLPSDKYLQQMLSEQVSQCWWTLRSVLRCLAPTNATKFSFCEMKSWCCDENKLSPAEWGQMSLHSLHFTDARKLFFAWLRHKIFV